MMCAKPCPLGWYGGILPQEFTSLGSLLEPKKCQKLAKNKPLSIKKYQLQNFGGGGGDSCWRAGGRGIPACTPPYAFYKTLLSLSIHVNA